MRNSKKERLVDKYQDHLQRAEGGIFHKKTRKRLLGIARPYGGDASRSISNFWNRTATYVENALVDLALFIETAETEKVNKVITPESLNPFFNALLQAKLYAEDVDLNRAEIAQQLVENGFDFLMNSSLLSLSKIHRRSIEEAIDLSRYLTQNIRERTSR